MARFFVLIFTILIVNCSSHKGVPMPSESVDTLKSSVLDSACNESHRKSLENTIVLQEKDLNEEELKRSLVNMKEDIKCG